MMPAPTKKSADQVEITIPPLMRGITRIRIIGTTPLFQNRMTAKVKMGLLLGSKKKTAAEKVSLKHHPLEEFRDSAEIVPGGSTALGLRVVALKAAMCSAAIETPGVTKASAQRLLFMPGELAPLYGIPKLRMDVVRSADINRTPDVRSRACRSGEEGSMSVRYTKEERQKIVEQFAKEHGGQFDAAEFLGVVQQVGAAHPAFDWFTWDNERAAREHRLDQARDFARGLVIRFEVETVERGKMRLVSTTAPLIHSPVDRRKEGGGYEVTDPKDPAHMAELCRQAAQSMRWYISRFEGAGSAGLPEAA